MATYSEKNSTSLLTGATDPDGDTITVRRINGTQISSWPYTVDLTLGEVSITEAGVVVFDDEGNTSGHPGGGQTQTNGSFTFTLWDGTLESAEYTATVALEGSNSAPTAQNHALVFAV